MWVTNAFRPDRRQGGTQPLCSATQTRADFRAGETCQIGAQAFGCDQRSATGFPCVQRASSDQFVYLRGSETEAAARIFDPVCEGNRFQGFALPFIRVRQGLPYTLVAWNMG